MKSSLGCAALALFLLVSPVSPSKAATFHLTGDLAAHNEVVVISFTLDQDADEVRIWTDSFRDGLGVDPLLALWHADGDLIDWNDDDDTLAPATQTRGDAGLFFSPLSGGDYVLTLTGLGNLPWGGSLSDGFVYDLDPAETSFGARPRWSLWLSAPGLHVSDVPEPSAAVLLAAGLPWVLAGKRRRSSPSLQKRIA